MKRIPALIIIGLLCLSALSIFSPNVHASVTIMPTRLPSARAWPAAVWDGNNSYIFGGSDSAPTIQILRYDPTSDTISVMSATLPDPVCDMPAVWTGRYAYLFGGYVAPLHTSDKIVRYDPLTDTTTVMGAKLPTYAFPVYSMSAIWDGNYAYLFGGYDGYSYFDHILRYDPIQDQLTTMGARLPSGLKWTSAIWTVTYAYIFGGYTPSGLTDMILRYGPVTDSIQVMSGKLPEPIDCTSAVWTDEYVFLFGGGINVADRSDQIVKYDPALDSVTLLEETLPSPRAGTCAIWDGRDAYVFGGEGYGTSLDEIVRFFSEAPSPFSVSISPLSASILMGQPVTFTSAVSGGYTPYSYQWYLNGNTVSGATSTSWTLTPTTTGNYTIHLNVTDNLGNTAKSNDAVVTVAAQLIASISPMSASVLVGQPVAFTSTVSGGYTPYSCQWYLNGNPVSGATSNTWTFTPVAGGIYYIHLKVTDAKANTAQSETARIVVATVPVGGYSFPIQVHMKTEPVLPYIALIATLTAIFTTLKSRIKRRKH
jgi:N-acetylneuraminic acid mutarotase